MDTAACEIAHMDMKDRMLFDEKNSDIQRPSRESLVSCINISLKTMERLTAAPFVPSIIVACASSGTAHPLARHR